MLRLVLFLLAVLAVASGLAWLADRPGQLLINWEGREIETSVFHAVVGLTVLVGLIILAWSLARQVWNSPASVGHFINKRRQRRGLDALSSGMIAVGAGDRGMATRYAIQARKTLPNEPLTHLLRAQAAQLSGDKATARRIFEAMLASPDTEQLGLRGLFLEAQREGEGEPALQFSQRALRLNPKLAWPVEALFDLQCRKGDWGGALDTLGAARRNGHLDKASADRRRAVLLTAQAQALEDSSADKALALALEAHAAAPDLIPAAAIAGRILASKGNTPRAAKVLQKTWAKAAHPELATAYAYARIGDSPRDRLDRVKQLAALNPHAVESPIAVAVAAIEARDWDEARHALAALSDNRLTQSAATLMARIEGEQHGDKGRVREWLARAVNAQRDSAWTADGVVAEKWAPVSPVTGALDAFQWRVPVERLGEDEDVLRERLNDLVGLGASPEIAVTPDAVAPANVAVDVEPVTTENRRAAAPAVIDVAPAVAVSTEAPVAAATGGASTAKAVQRTQVETAATQPAPPVEAEALAAKPGKRDPHIFVPPPAPDDPGTDADGGEDLHAVAAPALRAT